MRSAQDGYLLALLLGAGAILAHSGRFIHQDEWLILLVLSLLLLASGLLALTDLSGGKLDFTAGAIMASLVVAGPHVALWAIAVGTLVETLIKSGRLKNLVFNLAQLVVAGWAAFLVFALLGGDWGARFNHPAQALVMAIVFLLVNAVLYAAGLHLSGLVSFVVAMRGMLSSVPAYLITLAVGIFGGFAYVKGGMSWAITVVGLAYMLHSTLRHYFIAIKQARTQTQQLEAVLNATQGALIMTDREGIVQVANRHSGVLFDVEPEKLIGQPGTVIPELRKVQDMEGQGQHVMEMTRGSARFVQWYRAGVQSAQGELQGHIQVFTDVTALKEAEENLRRLNVSMIKALTAAIDARDSYTHGHSSRVAEYSVTIARKMGLSGNDLERLGYAGLLHDIGKLGIGDRVLNKRGPLTTDERALMMQHPVIGAEVLEKANVLTELIPGVRWHHEWVSGGGYPDGLKGEEIPLDARIIGVADALDAMTTDRQYRAKMPLEEALNRVRKGAGVQFDPDVAEALAACIESGELVIGHGNPPSGEPEPSAPLAEEARGIRPIHGKELSIFYQLSRADYTSLDLETMLRKTLETCHEIIGQHIYLVFLSDPATGLLELRSAVGLQDQDSALDKDRRLVEEALAKGTPVVIRDLRTLEGYRAASAGSKSEVVIPLVTPQEVFGALVVEGAMPDLFQRDEIYLLETMGQQLCGMIKLGRFHERLIYAANHDSLTGVFNHRYFYERLSEELERSVRFGRPVSVGVIDVQGLKAINDTYGHLTGDEALRAYGRSLYEMARPADVVARHGGDEFLIIMPDLSCEAARLEVQRLLQQVEEHFGVSGLQVKLTTSAWGVASYPVDGQKATDLVSAADRALYRERQQATMAALPRE